ncbi:mechanosensitive ion channel domain-containing protein [Sorangium sp. So ce136]|uniref:mechanosensitive ion channel family protein n=1 Tax=Sorangium sp. So ce136 TaxID=3133284 RepID=UPI003F000631
MNPDVDDADVPDGARLIETIQVGGVITGVVILSITWFAVRLITAALERSGTRFAHRRLLLNQIATLLRFFLYIGGIAIAVGASINLSREVILALTGTVAVTIGFALKDLAASVLAGVTLIIDRSFQVGDRVKFDAFYGEVTSMGLRSVRIITLDNHVVTIPNNKFLTEAVASANHGRLDMLIPVEFFISSAQDIAIARRIVEECITSNRYVFLGKPWCVVTSQVMSDVATVRLVAKAYVLDVKYEAQYATTLTERVLAAFREKRIALPGEPG